MTERERMDPEPPREDRDPAAEALRSMSEIQARDAAARLAPDVPFWEAALGALEDDLLSTPGRDGRLFRGGAEDAKAAVPPTPSAFAAFAIDDEAASASDLRYGSAVRDAEDLSEDDWLVLECRSLTAEAATRARSLDDTLAYVRSRCDAVVGRG